MSGTYAKMHSLKVKKRGFPFMFFYGNPLFLLFTSMIVKDSVNIAGNQIEFELRNKFQDLFIEEFSIENGKIEIEDKTLPFNFGVSETVKLKITLNSMEAKLIIKTRQTSY